MRRLTVGIMAYIAFTLAFIPWVGAGTLDDFEDAATKEKTPSGYSQDPNEDSDDDDNVFFGIVFELIQGIFALGEAMNKAHTTGSNDPGLESIPIRSIRENGAPNLPFVRCDAHYQWVDSDIYAADGRLEAGFGPVAGQIRHTRFKESSPDDSLNITYIHGLCRISGSRLFECDLGVGSIAMEGDEKNSGFSMAMALSSYPFEHFGVRFAPTFSKINGNSISDIDISLAAVYPFAAVQVGYRSIETHGVVLDGPYAGFSFFF